MHYWLYRQKYQNARILPLKKPVDISLELTSHCNQRCVYCYHSKPKELPFVRKHIDLQLALKIIKDGAELGVNSLKLNGRGESTLHPNFFNITYYAKTLASGGTYIDRITNSNFNFPDKEHIFLGLLNQTKVKVSFDSFRKEVIESVRIGTNFERAMYNMKKFYNCSDRKTRFVIQCVRTKANADEDLELEIKKHFPSAEYSIREMVEGRTKNVSNLKNKERSLERESCVQAHARLVIHSDGKVAPCCPAFDGSLIIGDTNTQSISEIWHSKNAKQLRKDLKSLDAFKKDPCKSCSSFESYKGFKPPRDS